MENNIASFDSSFSNNKVLVVCPAVVEACKAFAEQRLEGSAALYQSRGEDKLDKMKEDIVSGALAEFAVHSYITSKGLDCTLPDLTILPAGKKSYSPDLVCGDRVIHVKSQTTRSAEKYGASWLFQKNDKVLSLPSEKDLMVFCLTNGDSVEIKAIVSVMELSEASITSIPKVWKYQHSKVAIYLDDVLKSDINLWRL